MLRRSIVSTVVVLLAFVPASAEEATTAPAAVDFAKDVKPIFAAHCVKCHGPDEQEAGLRLDHRTPALRGGDSGKAFVPGQPEKSLLVERVTSKDTDEVMPPPFQGVAALKPEQIETLRRWVAEGAEWPDDGTPFRVKSDHWAFQPIERPELPAVRDEAWVRNEIDRFVLAGLEKDGIAPSPAADRYTLVKRLYYDLVGLPPEPAVVDAFVESDDPRAYEELVDRLLASKHFGERWGRHWLDKARYADSDGYEKDRPRPNAWRYRDWVVDAVDRDLPFDEFTKRQLAGDLLSDPSPDDLLATAFHRQTLTNTEGGTDKEQFRVEAVFDRVETTGTVWLGLTVGCARCHTHKYDPLAQSEYYQLFAFFNDGDEANTEIPTSAEAVAKYEVAKAEHDARKKELTAELAAARTKLAVGQPKWEEELRTAIASEAENVVRRHDVEFDQVASLRGQKLVPQEDGSLLATGDVPADDTTTLTFEPPVADVTGFRLDTLPHESLGANGPGRTDHGNFVLTRFRVFVTEKDGKEREVAVATAKADFSQDRWVPTGALTDKERTGWAVAPQFGKPHWIEFRLKAPLPGRPRVRVELEQNYGERHVIGRFRLRAVTGTDAPVDLADDLRAILALDPGERTKEQASKLREHFLNTRPELRAKQKEVADFDKSAPKRPYVSVRVIRERSSPRDTRVLRRGDFLQPMDPVQPGAFAVLPAVDSNGERPTRLDLAEWLMAEENPLTGRVAVNHVWSHLFGRGLVGTMNDFGTRGEKPTHPELLDWLATEYRRLGWSRKTLLKTIVMSATYRQASRHRPDLADVDPRNERLARQNRFRVEAEIVRDLHLAASGLLSRKVGGPSVFPPLPAGVAALSYANNFRWNTSKGEDRYRRGMYTFFKRTSPHPNLISFDCPDSNTTNVNRNESNTPLQALVLLNNEVFTETAQHFAKLLLESDATTDEARLTTAFRRCVARPPSESELSEFAGLLKAGRTYYAEHPDAAAKLTAGHAATGVPAAESAAWVATCRILANMDEFITRE